MAFSRRGGFDPNDVGPLTIEIKDENKVGSKLNFFSQGLEG
jgi:hypothetical protein